MAKRLSGGAIAILALLGVMAFSPAASADHAAGGGPTVRVCGLTPGDGAYSYIRTVGIRCAPAWRVAYRARKRFCNRHNDCRLGPGNIDKEYRGRVGYNGWSCHVRDGWEFIRVRCAKRQMRILWEAAS